jgi:ankyrin repeat protein
MKQDFIARMRTALDEIEQNAPTDLALFEYVDLFTAQIPRPTLFAAAAEGDMLTTRALLLRHGVDVNAENDDGVTPRYIAAAHGHTELVEVLADVEGADVNLGTPVRLESELQLVEAWKDDPPSMFIRSLDHGAVFPLYIAARNGNVDTVRALLQRGAEVDQLTNRFETALMGASRDGRSEVIKLLLDHGADVNKNDIDGRTPVYAASKGGHAEVLKVLLAAGAATDVHNAEGKTLVHAAAEGGHSEIITMLLDHGGLDIEHVTSEAHHIPGSTALNLAAHRGHVEAVKLLFGRGADVNKVDDEGETSICGAAFHGHVEVLKLLLDCGVDVNKANNRGETTLYTAAEGGHAEAITLLLDCGADVNKAHNDGRTPLFAAARGGHVAAIKLLLGRVADIDKANNGGETPLHIASARGNADAVHVLLKAGADARVATSAGVTALHNGVNATRNGYLDVVRVLAERWPTNPLAWRMFLMGGGAASELQDYLAPPANRTMRNHLPRLYSKPDMMKEVYKYLYKPRYADLGQTDVDGMTALQVAELNEQEDVATLLRELGLG